ncbi:hypothetical protein GGX14DRAFT_394991 [Mycena pura]|uniref:Uncharacterized protein n=1 Tax=Mycena pura TaxID=153505 RepID=A0AAD6VGR5_9AGAR|nr:hypothetical protein GGX14DRAFT_394991 [Mycena pura]
MFPLGRRHWRGDWGHRAGEVIGSGTSAVISGNGSGNCTDGEQRTGMVMASPEETSAVRTAVVSAAEVLVTDTGDGACEGIGSGVGIGVGTAKGNPEVCCISLIKRGGREAGVQILILWLTSRPDSDRQSTVIPRFSDAASRVLRTMPPQAGVAPQVKSPVPACGEVQYVQCGREGRMGRSLYILHLRTCCSGYQFAGPGRASSVPNGVGGVDPHSLLLVTRGRRNPSSMSNANNTVPTNTMLFTPPVPSASYPTLLIRTMVARCPGTNRTHRDQW